MADPSDGARVFWLARRARARSPRRSFGVGRERAGTRRGVERDRIVADRSWRRAERRDQPGHQQHDGEALAFTVTCEGRA